MKNFLFVSKIQTTCKPKEKRQKEMENARNEGKKVAA